MICAAYPSDNRHSKDTCGACFLGHFCLHRTEKCHLGLINLPSWAEYPLCWFARWLRLFQLCVIPDHKRRTTETYFVNGFESFLPLLPTDG